MRMDFALSGPTVRHSMVSVLLVLVLAVVPVACGGSDDDDLAVASDLIEQYVAGWNDKDPDAVAAVYTEDATFFNEGAFNLRWYGREGIRNGVAASVARVDDMESTGPVAMADDGAFSCTIRFQQEGYGNTVAENEFEVEDGLISRMVGQVEFTEEAD